MQFMNNDKVDTVAQSDLKAFLPTGLSWAESDLKLFGSTLGSLPRVQYLEMSKSLNYHFFADIVSGNPAIVDQFAPLAAGGPQPPLLAPAQDTRPDGKHSLQP